MMHKNKIKVYGLLIIILFIVGIGVLFFEMSSGHAYKNDEVVYQVLAGNKRYYEEGTKFVYKENGTSYLGAKKSEFLSDSPIYLNNKSDFIVLSNDQIYVNGSTAQFSKVKAFSTFDISNGLQYNNKKINGGFLFNGRNSYIFLEKMTITINGKTIKVNPFSFVELNDYTYVLYDVSRDYIEAGKLYVEDVKAEGKNYVIDLSNDIFKDSSGQEVLIYVNTSSLDELE